MTHPQSCMLQFVRLGSFNSSSKIARNMVAHDSLTMFVLQCVDLKPDWPKGYSRLGGALFGKGSTQDATEAYKKGTNTHLAQQATR